MGSTRQLVIFRLVDFIVEELCVMLDFAIILLAMYLLPQYLQRGLLLPVAFTGMIMLPGGIVNTLVSALSGRLFNELGVRKPVIAGFLIAIGGIVLLLLSQSHSTVGYIITAHVVLMIGCHLVSI